MEKCKNTLLKIFIIIISVLITHRGSGQELIVDNFQPFVKKIVLKSDNDVLFEGSWEYNEDDNTLVKTFGEKCPVINIDKVNTGLVLEVYASEAMNSMAAKLIIKEQNVHFIGKEEELLKTPRWDFYLSKVDLKKAFEWANKDIISIPDKFPIEISGIDLAGSILIAPKLLTTEILTEIPHRNDVGEFPEFPDFVKSDKTYQLMLIDGLTESGQCIIPDFEYKRTGRTYKFTNTSFSYSGELTKCTWFVDNELQAINTGNNALKDFSMTFENAGNRKIRRRT